MNALAQLILVKLEGLESLAEHVAYELSEYLAPYGGFALPQRDGVAVDLSLAWPQLEAENIAEALRLVLRRMELDGAYVMEIAAGAIHVRATSIERARRALDSHRSRAGVEVCPHCGYTTPYPELMREHIKIHYLL